eukprot:80086-Rhodomonas_salina.1
MQCCEQRAHKIPKKPISHCDDITTQRGWELAHPFAAVPFARKPSSTLCVRSAGTPFAAARCSPSRTIQSPESRGQK